MKRIFAVILVIAVILSITACSNKKEPGESTVTKSDASKSPSKASQTPATKSPSSQSPSSKSPSSKSPESVLKFKDGTYDEKGDPWAQGQEEAIVIVKDGKISSVTLMRLDKSGKEVDYNMFDGKEHDGKVYPNLKEFRETMAKKIVEIQSSQVETISGATVTSGNWKVAVQKALDKANPESKKSGEKSESTPKSESESSQSTQSK